ncbi:MAG: hypothetical protein H9917_00215 [Candidatus Oceanisphaera merdipullorum]|nr:hypothetical protein [Candidatus Oceanisphaera merdipullorum]
MQKYIKYLLIVIFILIAVVVGNNLIRDPDVMYELRGRYKTSSDGQTYLVIEDDNGGKCGLLLVDKIEWSHGINNKGKVEPGVHDIECGTGFAVNVREGTTYYLNYWGP